MSVIVTAGMIGIGKSTFTEELSNHLGTTPFYEPVDTNPILDKYYEDPAKYGFSLQIYFLNKRFRSIKKALTDKNNVLDRSIYEDALFTKVNVDAGNISEESYNIYLDLLDNMMQELEGMPKKAPDLLVYLTADFDTILKHIKKRGRSFEQIDNDPSLLSYYKDVYSRYDPWYEDYNYSPKMKIDLTNMDIATPEGEAKALALVDEKLEQLERDGLR